MHTELGSQLSDPPAVPVPPPPLPPSPFPFFFSFPAATKGVATAPAMVEATGLEAAAGAAGAVAAGPAAGAPPAWTAAAAHAPHCKQMMKGSSPSPPACERSPSDETGSARGG